MSTVTIPATCECGSIGRSDLRQCPEHRYLWRGDRRLASVTSITSLLPQKPCNDCGAQSYRDHRDNCRVFEKIENARIRGSQVDEIFCALITRKLACIPGGTRQDARDLVKKLVAWFQRQDFEKVETQVLVGDDEVGGLIDLRCDGHIFEVKATYEIGHAHILQAAGYGTLDNTNASVLHVTERYAEPKEYELKTQDYEDWQTLRGFWKMAQRRT